MAGGVGAVLGLAQQRLPFMPRQAAIVEIGARPFAAVVEEADVVVGLFQRLDLARDEAVEFVEIGDQVGRKIEIQGIAPLSYARCCSGRCEEDGLWRGPRLRNWMVRGGAQRLGSAIPRHRKNVWEERWS